MELSLFTHIEVDRSQGQVCGHYIVHLVCASTVFSLLSFHTSSTPLSSALEQSLASDPIAPVLAAKHLLALDRKLAAVLAVVRDCVAAAARPEDVVMVRDECYTTTCGPARRWMMATSSPVKKMFIICMKTRSTRPIDAEL